MKPVIFRGEKYTARVTSYPTGVPAIVLVDDVGQPELVATKHVPEAELQPGETCVKDYSENDGVLQALVSAGVVEDTGVRLQAGWTHLSVVRVVAGA